MLPYMQDKHHVINLLNFHQLQKLTGIICKSHLNNNYVQLSIFGSKSISNERKREREREREKLNKHT